MKKVSIQLFVYALVMVVMFFYSSCSRKSQSNNDGFFRESKFNQIVGADFIGLAFEFAHEANLKAELYYNDY